MPDEKKKPLHPETNFLPPLDMVLSFFKKKAKPSTVNDMPQAPEEVKEQDVKRIILTHSDIDHIGSLAALQKATGARTYASQTEADAIAMAKPSREIKPKGFSLRRVLFTLMRPFIKVTPFQIHEIVAERQTLPALGGLQVLETPGHTPGHISLFAPTIGVLFCGDSMVADENGLQGSRPGITWDESKARASERKQAGLGAQIVCSGHGPAVREAAGKFPI